MYLLMALRRWDILLKNICQLLLKYIFNNVKWPLKALDQKLLMLHYQISHTTISSLGGHLHRLSPIIYLPQQYWQGRIYHGTNGAAAPGPHQNRGPHHKNGKCHVHFMNMLFFRPYFEWNLKCSYVFEYIKYVCLYLNFKYKQTYLMYSDTYEHALFGVWWGSPHFSGNFMQSYIVNKLHITNVSDNIIFAWLYDFPTKIGAHQKKSRTKHYMFNICS